MNSRWIQTSPSRRTFIKAAGVAALAAAVPRIAMGGSKHGLDPIILGEGDHQYEVIHDWGKLPAGMAYGNTHGVCEDAQGNIYIKHTVGAGSTSDDCVVVFDPKGKFIRSWGPQFKGGGAHGLHLSKEGGREFLYLCDCRRGTVEKTDLKGERVWELGVPDASGLYASPGEYKPTNIAIAPSGDFYIADGYGKSWIHHYNAKAEYVRSFGGPGSQRGQVSCPHGIMVDTRGPEPTLIVADRSNHRLQVFGLDGRHKAMVTAELRSPCHFHTRGTDLLVPDLDARVSIFDKDNKLIVHLGDGTNYALRGEPREKFIPGKFIAPHSAIFDHEGNIFVVEWVEVGRVTKLRKVT